MTLLDKDVIEKALKSLNAGIKSKRLYPPGHPAILTPLKGSFNQICKILEKDNPVVLGRVEDVVVFGRHSFLNPVFHEVVDGMKRRDLKGISFKRGVTLQEFISFIDIIFSDSIGGIEEIKKELVNKGILHISIKSLPTGSKYLEVYHEALDTVIESMEQVRLGLLPKTRDVVKTVDDMTPLILEDRNTMIGLTMIKDYDNYLFTHSVNVSILATALGDVLGIEKEGLQQIGVASLLHDIGKTGIGEKIIKKPGHLNQEEWNEIKEHPLHSFRIIERMEGMTELPPRIALEHHVGYDMKGYPEIKTMWEKPHPYSMVVTIADTYDAITTLRPYQRPYDPVRAVKRIQSMAGRSLDPKMVRVFINMLGLYPVGTLVRLHTNEVGIIVKINSEDNLRPVVKIIYDREGSKLKEPFDIDLSQSTPNGEGPSPSLIVATLDPISKNINISDYFKQNGESQQR